MDAIGDPGVVPREGQAFTQRDASARTVDHIFTRDTPRDPQTWATFQAQPEPGWTIDYVALGKALGYLGKDVGPGIIEHARQTGIKLPPQLDKPSAELTLQLVVEVIRDVASHCFPPAGARQRRGWPLSQ